MVFDINDFDETLPAPWEYDVKRLAASIVLDCREHGFDDDFARNSVIVATQRYAHFIRLLAAASSLEVHYAIVDEHNYFDIERSKRVRKHARKPQFRRVGLGPVSTIWE